jgi:hypothetical protein
MLVLVLVLVLVVVLVVRTEAIGAVSDAECLSKVRPRTGPRQCKSSATS